MNDYLDYLQHHGIKGQKWGIRRYQNYDGTYTRAGVKRYGQATDRYNQLLGNAWAASYMRTDNLKINFDELKGVIR